MRIKDAGALGHGPVSHRKAPAAHEVAEEHEDVATASLIENWIDQTEKRTWFLFEAARDGGNHGH